MKPSTFKTLQLLRDAGAGGVTTGEFMAEYIGRAAARILELRREHGYEIRKEPVHADRPQGPQRYVLVSEPADGPELGGTDDPPPSDGGLALGGDRHNDRRAVELGPGEQLELGAAA